MTITLCLTCTRSAVATVVLFSDDSVIVICLCLLDRQLSSAFRCFWPNKWCSIVDFRRWSSTLLHGLQNNFPPLACKIEGYCFARSLADINDGRCDLLVAMTNDCSNPFTCECVRMRENEMISENGCARDR